MASEIATASPCEIASPKSGSMSCAMAGSPRKPMPSEASVMPNWHALRYSLRSSWSSSARCAPALPLSARSCNEDRLERTRPNSAATKKPFMAIRTATARSSRTVTRLGRVRARRYFERGRRSWSDGENGTRLSAAREGVDRRGQVEVRLGEPAGGVVGDRQPDLVPPVDEDVGVVAGRLRRVGDRVDPGHRGGEVGQLAVAGDRVALAAPAVQRRQPLLALGIRQQA